MYKQYIVSVWSRLSLIEDMLYNDSLNGVLLLTEW